MLFVKIKIIDETNQKDAYVTVRVIRVFDSIIQGFKDNDLPDGNYEIAVNGQIYQIELINYYDNMKYMLDETETEKVVELGDETTDYKMLVVKYHKDLIVDEGITLTAKRVDELTYKKGMYICVLGDILNRGNISMTARGTYNQEGENVYLWKNIDNTYEYVPAAGGMGGAGIKSGYNQWLTGKPGENGTLRATGGGGSGGTGNGDNSPTTISGSGSQGTSYSGGSGGGGSNSNSNGLVITAKDAEPNGGAGRRS